MEGGRGRVGEKTVPADSSLGNPICRRLFVMTPPMLFVAVSFGNCLKPCPNPNTLCGCSRYDSYHQVTKKNTTQRRCLLSILEHTTVRYILAMLDVL